MPAAAALETHLFAEVDAVIAGGFCNEKTITVELLKFIRPEKSFSGIDELRARIRKDVKVVKNYPFLIFLEQVGSEIARTQFNC